MADNKNQVGFPQKYNESEPPRQELDKQAVEASEENVQRVQAAAPKAAKARKSSAKAKK